MIVCEDGDLATAGSEPASMLNAFGELFAQLGVKQWIVAIMPRMAQVWATK